ncbi:MAG: hypothetical protein GKR89_04885 [Candidatus Latescibacteria bacterium]|nr:hypothetical protein [Candidatus Latescibacterota bacterium]
MGAAIFVALLWLATAACGSDPASPDPPATTVLVDRPQALIEALQQAGPGTRIELAPGEYGNGHFFTGLQGAPGAPLIIAAADPQRPPTFSGGSEGLHLIDPVHVELQDLVISGASGNGLNIDDGGTFDTPAHHVVLRRLQVRDIGPAGNRDGIKLSGVDNFVVENCLIERWGQGGSGIDMVGCHDGLIRGNTLRHDQGQGGSGIQAKGGSRAVVIRGNRFEHSGQRAVNIGGSTGLAFFRPNPHPGYEAKDITVEGNTFVGGAAPVAFVGVDGALVRFNTIYRPSRWVMRILQETKGPDFALSRNGVFSDNIVAFSRDKIGAIVNIGPDTAPETFHFARNVWYALDDPDRSAPSLPTPEENGHPGIDPDFIDAANGDFTLAPDSPAAHAGAQALPSK